MVPAGERAGPAATAARFVNVPLVGWLISGILGGLFYYLDALAPYREVGPYSKDRIEDCCLWLAAIVSAAGIVFGGMALMAIQGSDGRLRGKYRVVTGMALSLLSLAAILFTIFARALVASMV